MDYNQEQELSLISNNRISNMQEYDYTIDEILVAEQTGRISIDEVVRLNNYLTNYEKTRQK